MEIQFKKRVNQKQTTDYYLVVPSWRADYGPPMRIPVSGALFAEAESGRDVVLVARHGRFGMEHLAEPPVLA